MCIRRLPFLFHPQKKITGHIAQSIAALNYADWFVDVAGPVLAVFPTDGTVGRAEGRVGAGAHVADREARHGQRQVALLRQSDDRGMPETVPEDIHQRVVDVVERFRFRVSVAPERGAACPVSGRR